MNMLRRLFNLLVLPVLCRVGVLPTSADGAAALAITLTSAIAAWTWGAWVEVAATVGTGNTQIVGFTLENFTGAASQGEVEVGSGAGGSEVALARVPAGASPFYFPHPVYIQGGVRVAARYRVSSGAADTVDIKLITSTGF